MRLEGSDTDAYLIRIKRDTAGVTISDMTLYDTPRTVSA